MTPLPADLAASLGAFGLKSLALFGLAGLALLALRRASAASRHLVCLLTLLALLLLPALSAGLPGWAVPALSLPAPPPVSTVAVPAPPVADTPSPPASSPASSTPATLPSTALVAPPTPPRPFPWASALFAFWLLGVSVASLRPLLGLWGLGRLRRDCRPVSDAAILSLSEECASALHLKRLPALWQADVPVPMTWGWRRPVVLLPLTAETWPGDRLRAVLLHEQAHVRRGDWLSHRLADLVCALYWFHPFAWWAVRRLRAEGEMACDDLVLSSGVAAPDYARHLLDVARGLHAAPVLPPTVLAMARTVKMEKRLTIILDATHPRHSLTHRARFTMLILASAALVMLAMLHPAVRAQAAFKPTSGQAQNNAPVQLVGITDETVPGGRWWGADGKKLSMPSLELQGRKGDLKFTAEPGKKGRFFAFRLPPAMQKPTMIYMAPDKTQEGLVMSTMPVKGHKTWHTTASISTLQTETSDPDMQIYGVPFPATLLQTSVRVGVASGPWLTVTTVTYHSQGRQIVGSVNGSRLYTGSLLPPAGPTNTVPIGSKIDTFIAQASDLRDLRAVAVDRQGRDSVLPILSTDTQSGREKIWANVTRPLSDIREIRIEARPFIWTEFNNVALQPTPLPQGGTEGAKP